MSSWYLPPTSEVDSAVLETPTLNPNPPPTNPQMENKLSKLLTKEENANLAKLLGKDKLTMSTTPVQLFVSTDDQPNWRLQETGVACFVRDRTVRAYFIEVYSVTTWKIALRHKLRYRFQYQMQQHLFFTFKGDQTMVGLNFPDEQESLEFRQVLDNTLEVKRKRRDEHIRSRMLSANLNYPITTSIEAKDNKNENKTKDKKAQAGKKREISGPANFRHELHIEMDAAKCFGIDTKDPILKEFFQTVGVNIDEANEDTKTLIFGFLEKAGGLEAVKNEMRNNPSTAGRQTVPQGGHTGNRIRPTPPPRPPPPKIIKKPAPPVPLRLGVASEPAPPTNAFVPPPPPPPPPAEISMPPLPAQVSMPAPGPHEKPNPGGAVNQSDFLRQIQTGVSLTPLDKSAVPEKSVDSISELMGKIKGFDPTSLKPVPPKLEKPPLNEDSLAKALRDMLGINRVYIQDSDSDDEKEDTDDYEEWD